MYEFTDPRLPHPPRVKRPGFHALHFTLTFITCGLWLPVWIIRSYSRVYPHASRLPS